MAQDWRGRFDDLQRAIATVTEALATNGEKIAHLSWQVDLLTRENRVLMGYLTLPDPDLWRGKPTLQDQGLPAPALANSMLCRQDSFEQPYFSYWTRRLASGLRYHRKLWEHVFICQALWERGAVRPGARALGFGVGREPLAALFAAEACDVVGTDMAPAAAHEKGWTRTAEHAAGLEALRNDRVCRPEAFDRRVTFEICDMNAVPDHLAGFDFCWSSCALEHLGSLEHGLAFIERSLDCLKPGGWAIHTTEFNLSSNAHTLAVGDTVLYRRQDMEALAVRLAAAGHDLAPFDFDPGLGPIDRYVDVAPYRDEPHLKLALDGYAATSIGIIVRRGDR